MGKGSKKLIYLDMSRCPQITIQGYYSIAKGFPSLETFILAMNYTITDQAIIQAVQKLTNLQVMDLQKCIDLTDQSIKFLAECRTLRKISLDQTFKISDAAFKTLIKYCPDLTDVKIIDCARVSDNTMKHLAGLENLVNLSVADCSRLSDAGVRNLSEGSSIGVIRSLDFTNVNKLTDISLYRIGKAIMNIRRLSLAYCENITDSGIEYLLPLVHLNEIDLSGTTISDETLAKLGKMNTLNHLTIQECPYITDTGVGKLCARLKDKLKSLDISHCKEITDKPMKSLAYNCRYLKKINLAGCWKLTDETPTCLAAVCNRIEIFDISGCYQMTDGSLRHFKKLKDLELLVLKFCRNITHKGYHYIKTFVPEVYYNHDDAPTWFGYDKIPYLANMEVGDIKPKDFLDSDEQKKKAIKGLSGNNKKRKKKGPSKKKVEKIASELKLDSEQQIEKTNLADESDADLPINMPDESEKMLHPRLSALPISRTSSRNASVSEYHLSSRRSSRMMSQLTQNRENLNNDDASSQISETSISRRSIPIPATQSLSLTDGSLYTFNRHPIHDLPEELQEKVSFSRAVSRINSAASQRSGTSTRRNSNAMSVYERLSQASVRSNTSLSVRNSQTQNTRVPPNSQMGGYNSRRSSVGNSNMRISSAILPPIDRSESRHSMISNRSSQNSRSRLTKSAKK